MDAGSHMKLPLFGKETGLDMCAFILKQIKRHFVFTNVKDLVIKFIVFEKENSVHCGINNIRCRIWQQHNAAKGD